MASLLPCFKKKTKEDLAEQRSLSLDLLKVLTTYKGRFVWQHKNMLRAIWPQQCPPDSGSRYAYFSLGHARASHPSVVATSSRLQSIDLRKKAEMRARSDRSRAVLRSPLAVARTEFPIGAMERRKEQNTSIDWRVSDRGSSREWRVLFLTCVSV